MFFFKNTCTARVTGTAKVKLQPGMEYMPLFLIHKTNNRALLDSIFTDRPDFISGTFSYMHLLKSLTIRLATSNGKKLGIEMNLTEQISAIAHLMKYGQFAFAKDENPHEVIILDISWETERYYTEWKEIVLTDYLKDVIRQNNSVVEDFNEYRETVLGGLEALWIEQNGWDDDDLL